MKQVFFLICFSFLLSFAAMAESPPDVGQATNKIEMNLHAQALPCVAPTVADVVGGNFSPVSGQICNAALHYVFQAPVEVQKSRPALQHGNNQYSCSQSNDNETTTVKATTSTKAEAPTNTNADFKVGWQGEGVKFYIK